MHIIYFLNLATGWLDDLLLRHLGLSCSALGCPAHITGVPPSGVGDAAHDISPPLDNQLVLELE